MSYLSKLTRFGAVARPIARVIGRPQFRNFSNHVDATKGVVFEGVEVQPPKKYLVQEAKLWGALCWFWVFYQLSENYDVLLGFRHPFEHRGHVAHHENELPDGTTPGGVHHH